MIEDGKSLATFQYSGQVHKKERYSHIAFVKLVLKGLSGRKFLQKRSTAIESNNVGFSLLFVFTYFVREKFRFFQQGFFAVMKAAPFRKEGLRRLQVGNLSRPTSPSTASSPSSFASTASSPSSFAFFFHFRFQSHILQVLFNSPKLFVVFLSFFFDSLQIVRIYIIVKFFHER